MYESHTRISSVDSLSIYFLLLPMYPSIHPFIHPSIHPSIHPLTCMPCMSSSYRQIRRLCSAQEAAFRREKDIGVVVSAVSSVTNRHQQRMFLDRRTANVSCPFSNGH